VLVGDETDAEEAWKYFTWMETCDWKHLPASGGLQDQDDLLMENIYRVKSAVIRMKHG